MTQTSRNLWTCALALAAYAWMFPCSVAFAHMGSTKYLFIDRTAAGARVVVEIEAQDVAYELDLRDDQNATLLAHDAAARAWLRRAITLRAGTRVCDARPSAIELTTKDAIRYVRATLEIDCASAPGALVLRDDAVFDDDPRHEAIVRLTTDAGVTADVLRTGRRTVALGDAPSLFQEIARFVWEGALHLFTGYDHILFLLSLLLVAGEVAAREGLRRAVRNVALVVTGFTLGHSITLIAAALDVVTLPSRFVESAIALSIVIVAVWNLWKPELRKGLPAVAVTFGLIHGFGFSSVLRELVLPRAGRVLALLSFNVGIELAQLTIVLVVMAPLAWAARKSWYRRVIVQLGSLAIALVATYWFVTRALGIE